MAYGILKCDTITFTDAGVDKSVTISGLVQNPTFSGNITVTGTVSGNTIQGQTVSGATITGGAAAFTTVTGGVATITSGVFALGSASNPSISFTGDANTGLYSPGADQVAISTNGTGRLFVDASGNVGVGLASAGSTFRSVGLTGASIIEAFGADADGFADLEIKSTGTSGASRLYFSDTAAQSGLIRYSHNTNSLEFSTAGNERLRITSAGLVGVGDSAPESLLHLKGSNATLKIESSVNTGYSGVEFDRAADDTHFAIYAYDSSHPTQANNVQFYGYQAGRLDFHTNSNASPRLSITSAGNVGVGTTNPAAPLDVNGAIYSRSSGVYTDAITAYSGSSLAINAGSSNLNITVNASERLRIDSSGRVGIGTSSPQADLHVNDATGAARLRFTGGAANVDNFEIGQAIVGVSNSGFSIYDVDEAATRFVIDSSGRVGIGTTSPSYTLDTRGSVASTSAGGIQTILSFASDGIVGTISNHSLAFFANNAERARIDTSGRLLVGTSTARTNFHNGADYTAQLQLEGTTFQNSTASLVCNSADDAQSASVTLAKSGGSTIGSNTLVSNGELLGEIRFEGSDGSEFVQGAAIQGFVDGAPGANDLPSRLVFSTAAAGASYPTERMRIDSAGNTRFNSASDSAIADPGVKIASSATIPEVRTVVNTADGGITNYSYYNTNATYNGYRFYVKVDGGVANHSVNNVNLSDRNVKKDISPAADTWNCIKEWEIVNYRYKDQPDDADLNLGVIAQQVAESCPEVITVFEEAKDDQPQKLGVKEQQMYWMAIKALQEAQVRIEQLEAKVAALEAL